MTPKELTVQAWILYKKMIDIEFSIIDLELLFGQKHKNKIKLQHLSKRAYARYNRRLEIWTDYSRENIN
jgi:hypothetical protein